MNYLRLNQIVRPPVHPTGTLKEFGATLGALRNCFGLKPRCRAGRWGETLFQSPTNKSRSTCTIRYKEENLSKKISGQMMQVNDTEAVWIGANDRAQEGNWQWTDSSQWAFTIWENGGFPNNSRMIEGEGENCAVLFKTDGSSEWKAVPCHSHELQLVCRRQLCSSGE